MLHVKKSRIRTQPQANHEKPHRDFPQPPWTVTFGFKPECRLNCVKTLDHVYQYKPPLNCGPTNETRSLMAVYPLLISPIGPTTPKHRWIRLKVNTSQVNKGAEETEISTTVKPLRNPWGDLNSAYKYAASRIVLLWQRWFTRKKHGPKFFGTKVVGLFWKFSIFFHFFEIFKKNLKISLNLLHICRYIGLSFKFC